MTYEQRTYRHAVEPEGLACYRVAVSETDLQVCTEGDLSDLAGDLVVQARWEIESFIADHPRFAESFSPYEAPEYAPALVKQMCDAGVRARVGPMAAVAGAIAEYVARGLAARSPEVVVENGGDIYLIGARERLVSLWAGDSPISGKVGLLVRPGLMPVSVCTSSGTVGHSTSFGAADAVTVLARDGALADAVATALANRVREPEEIARAVEAARQLHGVLGVMIAVGGQLGAWGNVHLVPLSVTGEGG